VGKSRTKSIKLRMRAFGMPSAQDIAFNNQSMKIFAQEIGRLNVGMENLVSGVNNHLQDGRSIDRLMRKFGKEQLKSFKGNFIRNPRQWTPLHKTARKIRLYKMNPDALKKDILKAVIYKQQETAQGIVSVPIQLTPSKFSQAPLKDELNRFFRTLDKVPRYTGGGVTPNYPALLYTGRLMRSMRFKYVKGRKTLNKKQLIYRRGLHYSTTAAYARTHFIGGKMPTYQLVITRESTDKGGYELFEFKFPIPNEYVARFKTLDLSNLLNSKIKYGVNIIQKMTQVEERNPYIFSQKDLRRLRTLNQNFGVVIPRAVDKKLAEALAK